MIKRIIRKKKWILSLVIIGVFGLLPVKNAFAYSAEGAVGTNGYILKAEATAGYAYMKNNTSKAATHSGVMQGQKQAFLGMYCGHDFYVQIPSKVTTYSGKTYYVDAAQHTILNASFVWYLNGTNIHSCGLKATTY